MSAIRDTASLRALYGDARERSRRKVLPALDRHARRFIELSPFCLLSTHGADGLGDVTPRGDAPGFVAVADDRTLLLPDRAGNNRLDSLLNILDNPGVGLLFMVPGVDETLRINGHATIETDPDLLARFEVAGKLPKTVLVIAVAEVYLHCAKALMRSHLWSAENRVDRAILPSMGEMMRDQLGLDQAETQAEMLERYRATLY
ncbi:pyridoxamine 5'-phosphate oxidase family protein [Oryzibacter oryziterrae]|uniref:pyridoxamine 5'-phosphate oxidase family protein n=1 Tax=Oryzibacter oryziterrae TaxID=2766474 RepID=UPI001F418A1F|nr:pyridoxamine 5'-phosphate oxidase family protein [Oryzibacter oryziterrae]